MGFYIKQKDNLSNNGIGCDLETAYEKFFEIAERGEKVQLICALGDYGYKVIAEA